MLFLLLLSSAQSLYFNLNGNAETCLGIEVSENQELWGAYVISGHNDKKVRVALLDPKGITIYISADNTREGSFSAKRPAGGIHRLCFRSLDAITKVVSFEVNTGNIQPEKIATEDSITPLENSLQQVSKLIDSVYRNLHFYQRRERVHRDLTERTCDRVRWAAGFKFFCLLAICALQLWGLTRLLSNPKAVKV
jgi:hypothetical protein